MSYHKQNKNWIIWYPYTNVTIVMGSLYFCVPCNTYTVSGPTFKTFLKLGLFVKSRRPAEKTYSKLICRLLWLVVRIMWALWESDSSKSQNKLWFFISTVVVQDHYVESHHSKHSNCYVSSKVSFCAVIALN